MRRPAYPRCPPLPAYGSWFTDAATWRPHVEEVLARHALPAASVAAPPEAGTHPVFQAGDCVVKFFAPHWPGDARAERSAYALLPQGSGLPVPRLLAAGDLYPGHPRWPWPYVVTSRLPGRSVAELWGALARSDRAALARALAPLVRSLHALRPPRAAAAPRPGWPRRLRALVSDAARRRRDEGDLPAALLGQLRGYAAGVLRGAMAHPTALVHADLTAQHVLLEPDGAGGWRVCGLVDFGDALTGDPAYDLVALHVDLFRCDAALLHAFLDAYGPLSAWGPDLRRRAMTYALVFPFRLFDTVWRDLPAARAAGSLDQLAAALWAPLPER